VGVRDRFVELTEGSFREGEPAGEERALLPVGPDEPIDEATLSMIAVC